MNYAKIRSNPTRFLALTSISITLFDEILLFFTDAHDEYFLWHNIKGERLSRRRRHVIQSNSPLPTVAERLFFILVYLKNNPQEYHGECFGMARQQCGQWIHVLTEIFAMAMKEADVLQARDVTAFKCLLDKCGGGP